MADTPLPHQLLWQARQIAEANGMFIVTVKERRDPKVPGDYINKYVLYRAPRAAGARAERLGKNTKPEDMLERVRSEVRKANAAVTA
jgi:hypothetical protein